EPFDEPQPPRKARVRFWRGVQGGGMVEAAGVAGTGRVVGTSRVVRTARVVRAARVTGVGRLGRPGGRRRRVGRVGVGGHGATTFFEARRNPGSKIPGTAPVEALSFAPCCPRTRSSERTAGGSATWRRQERRSAGFPALVTGNRALPSSR